MPTARSVTNTPAIPTSLILRARPRIVPRCSTPRMVTWSCVSISYRRNIAAGLLATRALRRRSSEWGSFFLSAEDMLELSVNCSENGTRLPNEDLRRPLPEAFFKIRNEKRVLSTQA